MNSPRFEVRGFNHVALVCSDMERTVDFYTNILGFPLVKTVDLPDGIGQHFFFDVGNGNSLAFFWFTDAPDGVPGISAPVEKPGFGEWTSAVSSLNHIAFDVPPEKFQDYRQKLKESGVRVGPLVNHDDSPSQIATEMHDGVYVRSFYFQDPDGILLEFACWMRAFGPHDVSHTPRTGADRRKPVSVND
ncbi:MULTISPECIES: VOC family protein [Rhodococcus]|uniref:Catechol 2,3-dioxygenase-like lactoylglutathione lyase family enzyme n=2 Tax=Nocardiaceae TaxID=85025 RepID=A0A652YZ70_NOCGL|nr:fosfomycin resistance protein FosB [Rhodococcus sp. AD45]PVX65287.1 catechol 2,3-dioxygenase-like lactoylglutathione lyase family enzyme [Rhodococcus globerulus]